jgi:Amt family ammonium transporter
VSHLYALAIVTAFTVGGSYILYIIAHGIIPFRVSEGEEEMGLDLSQHGESLEEVGQQVVPQRVRLKVVNQ